ncbi:hypothetical protein GCM10009682_37180 [Luedemannella flava]|uniref:Fibronectin type III domain-containing protein n=1 Tax=Luedemannella flava TaxID=349316 RepID=A0ABP4YDI2_9ACTN
MFAASLVAVVGTVTAAVITAPKDDRTNSPETVMGAAGSAPPATVKASRPPTPSGGQAPSAQPASDVRLRDEQRSVTISWRDPSNGVATARLKVNRDDQVLFEGDVPAGVDHYRLDGLSPDLNLCVTVTLVYPDATAPTTEPVCTDRTR